MITKLRLTARILFFYAVTYIVAMVVLLGKSLIAGTRRAKAELVVVWGKYEKKST